MFCEAPKARLVYLLTLLTHHRADPGQAELLSAEQAPRVSVTARRPLYRVQPIDQTSAGHNSAKLITHSFKNTPASIPLIDAMQKVILAKFKC